MRHTLLVAALLAVTHPTLGREADADADADAEKEVAKLSKQMTDALVKGDMTFLGGVMADDWMIITGDGLALDKSQLLKEVKDGTVKYEALDKPEMKVRVYGDAAVVTGRAQSKIKVRGQEVGGADRFTEVYARQGGKWRCVSTQVTPITAQSGEKP
jgi:ketosteroid isomerase-like protein